VAAVSLLIAMGRGSVDSEGGGAPGNASLAGGVEKGSLESVGGAGSAAGASSPFFSGSPVEATTGSDLSAVDAGSVSGFAGPEGPVCESSVVSSLDWPGLASGEFGVLDFENKENANDMSVGMRVNPTTRSER